MQFKIKLNAITKKNNSLLCVGLDSDIGKIPKFLIDKNPEHPQLEFNKWIIDATHDLVCAYKPNIAFYEALGQDGVEDLQETIEYLKENHPEIPVILDAKLGDIGNTNEGYVKFAFEYLDADSITLHPYLGKESLKPFLDRDDKMVFILCRTSNPGSGEFQNLTIDNKPLYQVVAQNIVTSWNSKENCGLVVGATYTEELSKVREIAGEMPILIPGIGVQGGDLKKTVEAGLDKNKENAIITSSRSILFVSDGEDFAQKAREEAMRLRDEINSYR